jgi:hypothetical protein
MESPEDVRNAIIDIAIALDEISTLEHMCNVHRDSTSCIKEKQGRHLEKYGKAWNRLLEVLM